MGKHRDPTEQLAKELTREIVALPARWQVWVFEWLREDLAAVDLAGHETDEANARMRAAAAALDRVIEHLGLTDQEAKLGLTMREFDAAPENARKGWTARRVAAAYRGSWQLAKEVAFSGKRFQVQFQRKRQRRQELPHKAREVSRDLTRVREWLATKPPKRTKSAFDAWRLQHNRNLPTGVKPVVQAKALRDYWSCPWSEVVAAAEENRLPRSPFKGQRTPTVSESDLKALEALRSRAIAAPDDLVDDPALRARRIRQLREAIGWSAEKLSRQAGLGKSVVGGLESERAVNPKIGTLIRIARAVSVSLDLLATDDGKSGFPPKQAGGRPREGQS